MRLFGERGYAATTIEDIATAAGVTVGTVYRYFTDKSALLSALVEEALQVPLLGSVEAARAGSDGDPVEGLRVELRRLWSAARTEPHRGVLRILVSDGGSFPQLATAYREKVLEPATRNIEQLLRRAGLAEADLAARAALGHLLGAMLLATGPTGHHPLVPQPAPLETTVDQLLAGILDHRPRGMIASETPLARGPRPPRSTSGPDAW